jgi:hypothetical protein
MVIDKPDFRYNGVSIRYALCSITSSNMLHSQKSDYNSVVTQAYNSTFTHSLTYSFYTDKNVAVF